MKELLHSLSREQVQSKLIRLEPQVSRSEEIAQELSLTVFDQEQACKAVGRRLAMFETSLTDPHRPLGVLYFVGPTGTGKTEMAHAAAKYMFNDPNSDRLRILNMSEYSEDHYAARLVGSPPSYVGYGEQGAIPHDWLHKGRSVIVFDEIEKAAPKVLKTLLSIMDTGILNARNGSKGEEPLNFRNSLIIFTSNIASTEISKILSGKSGRLGFGVDKPIDKHSEIRAAAEKGLKDKFPPEWIDRVDDVVIFEPIVNPVTLDAITTKFLGERNDYLKYVLAKTAPYIALTSEARAFILEQAKDKGGRGIKKALEAHIFDRFADVVSGIDYGGKPFVADIENGKTVWYTDDSPAVQPEPVEIKPELKKKEEPEPTPPQEADTLPNGNSGDGTTDGTGGGDISKENPKRVKTNIRNVSFHVPVLKDGETPITIDLAIKVITPGRRDMMNVIEGLPLLKV